MMTHTIEIDGTAMMRQAGMTAETYFYDAITAIDKHWGNGFSKEHPELIGSFMQAASIDFAGSCIAQQIRGGLDNFDRASRQPRRQSRRHRRERRSDHPLMGQTFTGITEAMQNIAGMLDIIGMRMPAKKDD
jgi:hypothetical protein